MLTSAYFENIWNIRNIRNTVIKSIGPLCRAQFGELLANCIAYNI